ncbi:MAG: glycosyltransferase family 1 protein, partial [Gammaproteobacteria bacterium]
RLPIALAAREAGWEVYVAAPASDRARRIVDAGFHFCPLPMRRGLGGELRALGALTRLMRRIRPNVTHLVTLKVMLLGGAAARVAPAGALLHAASGLGWLYTGGGLRRAVLRRVAEVLMRGALRHSRQRVIFQNRSDRELFRARGLVRDGEAVLIGGAGVDLQRFRVCPEPQGAPPTVVLPARMLWDKGVGEFVAAAGMLRQRGLRARFVLVGGHDPANPAAVPERQLGAWQATGVVEWWGHREDMPEVLAGAHVVCLPSYREGFPKVLQEAAACGRAVVTTAVPGCRDAVVPGITGLLVPPRDPEALGRALEALLRDEERRRAMGTAGRRLAEERFDVRHIVRAHLDLYRALLNRGSEA